MDNPSNLLDRLKDSRINWKYVLIVVILALIGGGGILGCWWVGEKVALKNQFSEIKTQEEVKLQEPKQGATEAEKVLMFLEIFPDAVTDSDLDKVRDIKERAEEFFNRNGEYAELDKNPDKEIIIIPQLLPKNGTPPRVGPFYIFRWEGRQWNLIGEFPYSFRSWYEIGEITANSLTDIVIRNHWSAVSHVKVVYKWDGTKYVLKEKDMCGWDQKLEEELNCVSWPEQGKCFWNDVEWIFKCEP